VAAGLAVAALGTDTGGSIRQPAAYCGIAGLMPTYGRVSRYGLVAFASSLDKIGPFTANIADAAAVMAVIAGHDGNDSTSAGVPVRNYAAEIDEPVEGLRIGVPEDYFAEGLDPEIKEKVQAGIALLERLGCRRIPLQMPHTDFAIATYYIIATAEASSNLARYDGVRYGLRVTGATLTEMYRRTRERGFGPEVKRRIMLGTYVLSAGYYDAYYLRAQRVRALIARDFADAFQKVDAIVTPTAPMPAFRLGEKTSNPLQMYLADIYTVTGSLAGVPGISVPCGTTKAGLPIGMQIFGPHFSEGRVLQIARAFEKAGGFSS
jgi:aspartyl-tRNA(Asn)/glutamyl-tRNA(Gln) amidotransferase subunit A